MDMYIESRNRIESIDILRGLVMLIMAIDHTREFFHHDALIGNDPTNFKTTWPLLFFTRWVTHLCAPVFVFLSGTSIFLYSKKGRTKKQVAFFLFTRGLFLIFAEIFLVNVILQFNYGSLLILEVIWVIGLSMMVLAGLQFLPFNVLLVTGIIIVFGHNLLDGVNVESPIAASIGWSVLHKTQMFPVTPHFTLLVAYPLLPWLALMIVGYCTGKLYSKEVSPNYRKKFLLLSGITVTALFIIIRFINVYGDANVWSSQRTPLFTFLDFIRTTKYPPSLLFMLMTIGPALIILSLAESVRPVVAKFLTVYGKVPFFYFVLHLLIIHSLALAFSFVSGNGTGSFQGSSNKLAETGYPLWVVYLVWLFVVSALYYPCKWYGKYKASHPEKKWLSYL